MGRCLRLAVDGGLQVALTLKGGNFKDPKQAHYGKNLTGRFYVLAPVENRRNRPAGCVACDVTYAGGDLHVYGVIGGELNEHGGMTVVCQGAIVTDTRR